MCFHVLTCVSLDYEVLMWLKIIFIGIMLSFMKLRGQTSKNIQDVQKLDLETCMCVSWVCLTCLKVLCNCFAWNWCGVSLTLSCIFTLKTSRYDSPRAPQEALKEDSKAIETLPIDGAKGYIIPQTPRWWWGIDGNLAWWSLKAIVKPQTQTTVCCTIRR